MHILLPRLNFSKSLGSDQEICIFNKNLKQSLRVTAQNGIGDRWNDDGETEVNQATSFLVVIFLKKESNNSIYFLTNH